MKEHSRMLTRPWILLVASVVLVASDALILGFALPHKALSEAVVAGVMVLVLINIWDWSALYISCFGAGLETKTR